MVVEGANAMCVVVKAVRGSVALIPLGVAWSSPKAPEPQNLRTSQQQNVVAMWLT